MKNEFLQNSIHASQGKIPLHVMINRVSASFLPSATRKRSFIVNDVPADMQVNTDENMVATVFGSLLNTVISHTENSCIRISASLSGKVVFLNLKENYKLNGPEFIDKLRLSQQLAAKIGGSIVVSNGNAHSTTIVFSFLNAPLAA